MPVLGGCAERPPAHPVLLAQFDRIAFSSEIGGGARAGYLVRWVAPIRIWLAQPEGIHLGPQISERIAWIAALTGHSIELARPNEGSGNLHIRVISREQVRVASGEDAPCYTRVVTQGGVIVFATIMIAPQSPAQIAHCLTEEMVQAMGLLDDSPLIPGSIFDDASTRPDLGPADRIMLRTLYDPRLAPGMPRHQALPIAARIIAEIAPAP